MTGLLFILSIGFIQILVELRKLRLEKHHELSRKCPPPSVQEHEVVFYGHSLELSDLEMNRILLLRNHYYRDLIPDLQLRFLERVKHFISKKVFIIKDDEGFREMPVLVSAAAIQLTFGLKEYLLPFYRYIRIYPTAYFGDHSFRVLAGNVQGNIITVAWNHFLDGFEHRTDGSNVGLHEMSHALYFQKMVVDTGYAKKFEKQFNTLMKECHEAHEKEKLGVKDLYSDYATTEIQEFWAESVELFFERAEDLYHVYPSVYGEMTLLLHQDPMNKPNPVIEGRQGAVQQAIAKVLPGAGKGGSGVSPGMGNEKMLFFRRF
jgi:hypothetical protein